MEGDSSPSIRRAICDLHSDQERHRSRASTSFSCDAFDSSEDEDDKKLDPTSQFQKVTGKLRAVQRLGFVTGVRSRHLVQFGTFNQKCVVRSHEHELFLSRMLNYGPLMAKLTHILHKFRAPLFGVSTQGDGWDKSSILNLITAALHDVKKLTTHVTWFEHVKPLRDELSDIRRRYSLLKTQFKEVRTAYLEEVAALRDSVRVRGDPMAAPGMSLDVTSFYEPTAALEPEERRYLLAMMKEKFKMMAENNPKVVRTFDFGQMERLMEQVESHEVTQLREALKRQMEENSNLRKALAGTGGGPFLATNKSGDPKKENDSMAGGLFQQLEQVRNQKDDLQHAHHVLSKQAECFEQERDELAAELRSLSTERAMLLTECDQLRVKLDEHEETNKELEVLNQNANEALQEQDTKMKSMEETLQRMMSRIQTHENKSAKPQQADYCDMNPNKLPPSDGYGNGPNPLPPLEADAAAGNRRRLQSWSFGDLEKDMEGSPKSSTKSVFSHREQNCSNEDQSKEVQLLKKRCAKLQELLSTHLQLAGNSQTETAAEEAENLALIAGSLGVDQAVDIDAPDGVRACRCGNLLLDDSKFCRKCGQEWNANQPQTRPQVIASLSLKLGDVAAQLEEAIKQLHAELEQGKDPKRAHLVAEAERKVTRLKREQKGYETQLLAERTMNSFQEVETMAHLEICNCNCFKELEVTRDMLRQLRSLCAEMATKIKQATEDNMQLNSALDSTLASLGNAKKLIGRSKAMQGPDKDQDLTLGLVALAEAEHNAVFHRLFNPNSPTKQRWKEKRLKLIQESMKAVESSFVLDLGHLHQSTKVELTAKKRSSGEKESLELELTGKGSRVTRSTWNSLENHPGGLDLTVTGANPSDFSVRCEKPSRVSPRRSREASPESQQPVPGSDEATGSIELSASLRSRPQPGALDSLEEGRAMCQQPSAKDHGSPPAPRVGRLHERRGSHDGSSAFQIKSLTLTSLDDSQDSPPSVTQFGSSPTLCSTTPASTRSLAATTPASGKSVAAPASARSHGRPSLRRSLSDKALTGRGLPGEGDIDSLVAVGEEILINGSADSSTPALRISPPDKRRHSTDCSPSDGHLTFRRKKSVTSRLPALTASTPSSRAPSLQRAGSRQTSPQPSARGSSELPLMVRNSFK